MEIHEILPHLTLVKIGKALKIANGNKERAIDMLLNDTVIEDVPMKTTSKNEKLLNENEQLEEEFLKQYRMYEMLKHDEQGLESPMSSQTPIDPEEAKKFNNLKFEQYLIDKKLREEKARKNVYVVYAIIMFIIIDDFIVKMKRNI